MANTPRATGRGPWAPWVYSPDAANWFCLPDTRIGAVRELV